MNGTNQKCKSHKRSRETNHSATTRTSVEEVLGMNRVGSPANNTEMQRERKRVRDKKNESEKEIGSNGEMEKSIRLGRE